MKLLSFCRKHIRYFIYLTLFYLFPIPIKASIKSNSPEVISQKIVNDWKSADSIINDYYSAVKKILDALPKELQSNVKLGDTERDYINACHWRRVGRISLFEKELKRILFARHHNLGGDIIGFLEEMEPDGFVTNMGKWGATPCVSKSEAYTNGGALCELQFKDCYPMPTEILKDDIGTIKDPCVSFDGKKVVFAWSKKNNGYHLWEMEINNPENIRQLTYNPEGLTVSDYEPCYLQNGDIIFNSSRCFGFVECYYNMTSNLFIINRDGKYLRRVGYDQVHTFYPTMMEGGKVLYSRWEYNDRNVLNCFGLFWMNPDGTRQEEYFGNQTEWPATIIQAREIPGSMGKVIAVIGGHRAEYCGDLVIIDPNKAKNGTSAVQLVAPKRPNPEVSYVDFLGNVENYNFQNPYPLDDQWLLVSWRPHKDSNYSIYLMNVEGERELLAWDENKSLSQPMSLMPKEKLPKPISYQTDYTKEYAVVTLQDAYYGTGTGSLVENGTIKKIRVIALEYRTDPAFGNTGSQGYQMTPVGRWTCSWEAKRVIGEIPVEVDGSAAFKVPARTPLYLQLVDEKGRMIQTMRSWMTLQPGEKFQCYGCHEEKTEAPVMTDPPIAKVEKDLNRVNGIDATGYFSYPTHIQPILDKNCVSSGCHDKAHETLILTGDKVWTGTLDADNRNACRFWNRSYINLTDLSKNYVNFIDVNTSATGLPPNSVGSLKSEVLGMMIEGHHKVSLSDEEFEKIALWIDLCIPHSGTYTDDMRETDAEKYRERLERRLKHEALEEKNIQEFISAGGYESYDNVSKVKWDNLSGGKKISNDTRVGLSAHFNSGRGLLSLHLPEQGTVSVLDIKGRVVTKINLRNVSLTNNVHVDIPCKLSAGVYVVKLSGLVRNADCLITVF